MKISIDPQRCKGCLSCELACSFHHKKMFCLDESSINITFDSDYGLHIDVLNTCDLCMDEEMPLCMEFCPAMAIKIVKLQV